MMALTLSDFVVGDRIKKVDRAGEHSGIVESNLDGILHVQFDKGGYGMFDEDWLKRHPDQISIEAKKLR